MPVIRGDEDVSRLNAAGPKLAASVAILFLRPRVAFADPWHRDYTSARAVTTGSRVVFQSQVRWRNRRPDSLRRWNSRAAVMFTCS